MKHEFDIGDEFKINHRGIYKKYRVSNRYKCIDPDKTFIVSKLSQSKLSVYYIDNRTSRKCHCNKCYDDRKEKCIGVDDILLVTHRLQRQRDISLRLLFGK